MNNVTKYSRAQIYIHWATALLVLGMAFGGLAYSYNWLDSSVLVGHQIGGQILIVLLIARIFLKLTRRTPKPHAYTHAAWERFLASSVHIALYLCLIAFAVTGYVSASALTNNVLLFPVDLAWARSDVGERFLDAHYTLKWVLLGLFVLHFAGTLKHTLIDRDDTLSHMIPSRKRKMF